MKISKAFTYYDLIIELWQQMHENWEAHGKDWTMPGFRAVAVYRFGNWVTNRSKGILRSLLLVLYRILYRFIRNHYGIELPETAKVGRRFVIRHQSGIVIHPNAEIGEDCLIRQNVTIGAANFSGISDAPKLGRRVQVGCGAVIVGKVTIGDDVLIGPNVVVMTNVHSGATVFVEAPRIIRMEKDETNGKLAGESQEQERQIR